MFKRKTKPEPVVVFEPPTYPVKYPVGSCVFSGNAYYRINSDGKRYRIPTKRILDSWAFPHIIPATEASLADYPVAVSKIGFRDGSLLNNIADGKIYIVSGSKLRHVVSPDVLARYGLSVSDAVLVSNEEINLMKQGESIF